MDHQSFCILYSYRQVKGENSIAILKDIVGPMTFEVAYLKHKNSIRAKIGSQSDIGIFCTEFEDDGELECDYFFKILCK